MALSDTARLATVLTLKDGLSPGLKKASGNVGAFDKGMGKAGKSAGRMAGGIAKAGAVVTGFAVAGLGFAAAKAIEWEDAFQGVVKTVDASESEFAALADSIRKMSTEMPVAATELAAIAEAGGAMGIAAGDIEAFTRQVAILASTTNVSAEDAASALGQLQNVIGLTGDEFDNFAATLVDLGNKGASTEADILEIARRAGGAAKLFGIGKDAILGWSSAVANLGVNAELGGTALQNTFLKLMPKVSGESKALQKIFGATGKEIKRMFAKDAGKALETFVRKLATLPKDARLDAIQSVFGKGSGITRVLLGLTNNVDGLSDSLATSQDAWKDATAASEEFEKRNKTVRSAITRLKNGITDAAISVGEGFAPALGRAADKLAAFLSQDKNRKKLEDFGRKIGDFIDKIDFDKVTRGAEGFINALKPAIGVIGQIASAISKLPPEVIGVGGATILADRLSGGAISSAAGGAVGGLAEALAKSMAAHIPVFGKAFVQPVFVTNPNFGGPGGKNPIDTVTDTAGKLGIVEAIRRSIARLKLPGGLIGGGGAGATGFDIEAFRNRAEAPGGPIDRMGGAIERHRAATISGTAQITANDRGEQAKLRALQAANVAKVNAAINTARNAEIANDRGEQAKNRSKLEAVKQKQAESIIAYRAGERATTSAVQGVGGKLNTANARLAAIRAKRMSFTTNVTVNTSVSVRTYQERAAAYARNRSSTNTQGP
jgi:TP901 family phage tail tape measure protein